MEEAKPGGQSYRALLREEFEKRRVRNRAFTFRSFAKVLGIAPSTLLGVIGQRRHFRNETALKVAQALNWDAGQVDRMWLEISHARSKTIRGVRPDREFYELCSWVRMGIARLALIEGVPADSNFLARKLQVPPAAAAEALRYLVEKKFVRIVNGRIRPGRSSGPFHVARPTLKAIEYQQELLGKASSAIAEEPFDRRLSLIRMIPLDERSLNKLARIIGKMSERIENDADPKREGKCLYGLSVQLFPICRVD